MNRATAKEYLEQLLSGGPDTPIRTQYIDGEEYWVIPADDIRGLVTTAEMDAQVIHEMAAEASAPSVQSAASGAVSSDDLELEAARATLQSALPSDFVLMEPELDPPAEERETDPFRPDLQPESETEIDPEFGDGNEDF